MDNAKHRNKVSPEKIILRVFSNELKSNLNSSRKKEALVTMARSLTSLFRDLGIPRKWMKTITLSPEAIRKIVRRDSKTTIPKKAADLVEALIELCKIEQSSELTFWATETLAEINTILDGKLIGYLKREEGSSRVYELALLTSKHMDDALGNDDTDVVRTVIRFWGKVLESDKLFEKELQRIASTSLTKLSKNARRFLSPEESPDIIPLTQISDPSQTVEVRQFAQLLQSSWARHNEGSLDDSTFESLRAFAMGFKNLDFAFSFGECPSSKCFGQMGL